MVLAHVPILHASTIALSAFLLFLVQPIVAKQILPWFGGSAAVWTTCMVFFQGVLLAGYAYSDALVRHGDARRQAFVHAALLLASAAWLPIALDDAFKPPDAENPTGRIVVLLGTTIGLPYLMLSTTGPLVQAWFARAHAGRRVYRLYALSNVASMAALLAYPVLIEPGATNRAQSLGWSAGYAVFVLLALAAAWRAARTPVTAATRSDASDAKAAPRTVTTVEDRAADRRAAAARATDVGPAAPTLREQALWLLLALLGSALLLAVTNHVTQNVAAIPFLWVLPLSLYLLSFTLCFDGRGWYWPRTYATLSCVAIVLMLGALSWRLDADTGRPERELLPITQAVPLYAAGLFVLCMFCHGELAARKPAPRHLTRFYLMLSLGGAAGGVLIGVLAPSLLSFYWELPAALALVALVLVVLADGWRRALAVASFALAAVASVDYVWHIHDQAIEISRNFYGALRVREVGSVQEGNLRRVLLHGVITHGDQHLTPGRQRTPTTYYGASSGIGRAIAARRADAAGPMRLGVVGLGTGSLAAYGRPGDALQVYELNPAVLELAQRRFTYLRDSAATVDVRLGDARLVLEREPPQRLDVLAVDAFSSDSIPAHLLTREAALLYRRHMADSGVIALHITNRYIDLTGVARQMGDAIGWQAIAVTDDAPTSPGSYRSLWVLLTANRALADRLLADGSAHPLAAQPRLRAWTDDYNNLFEVLK